MKKRLSVLLLVLLSGCANVSQMPIYTVTDQELEQTLDNQLTKLQKTFQLTGVSVTLDINDMSAHIGPDGRDVVRLGANAAVNTSVFGFVYPATAHLELEGTPYYDRDKKAIFVRSLALIDSTIDSAGFQGNLAPVSGQLMMLINGYLASHPVYQLEDNLVTGLISTVPLELRIEPGQLALRRQGQ
ncbi:MULTISPECIES: DUF1439 domain-containing protein [unclassified Vibrio]|uniref:DUF1439 domain-containing protein n=1 Tax=Vibrio sp. HB236076 TaxID=3232307 RepID=A0AB39HD28_9VIBR|nr:DUF1439 domain-containing protein [Vibrio sp. HB161653]MDP5255744.1 DUF1439 domain-containing protein [Vibrio sp. HB161653]